MWIVRDEDYRGQYHRRIVPERSGCIYVRRKIGREHWDARLAEIRAHLDMVHVLARIRDARASAESVPERP